MEEKFGELLTKAVHLIKIRESKNIQVIQDELGFALGRNGGTAIEYWRQGHIPAKLTDVEILARELIRRTDLDRNWLKDFLDSANYPYREQLCIQLFSDPKLILQRDFV